MMNLTATHFKILEEVAVGLSIVFFGQGSASPPPFASSLLFRREPVAPLLSDYSLTSKNFAGVRAARATRHTYIL